MTSVQDQLWPDPEPWRTQMERDAFEIAFPEEERVEGDRVDVTFTYYPGTAPHGCEICGWDSGSPAESEITVIWSVPNYSDSNPANSRPGHRVRLKKTYEEGDAEAFWLRLMRKGASA